MVHGHAILFGLLVVVDQLEGVDACPRCPRLLVLPVFPDGQRAGAAVCFLRVAVQQSQVSGASVLRVAVPPFVLNLIF